MWKKMGSPENPTVEQISELQRAGQLQLFGSPEWIRTNEGKADIKISMPRQGVSLLKIEW
jgi:xylan 1,4-beta-xylosidase